MNRMSRACTLGVFGWQSGTARSPIGEMRRPTQNRHTSPPSVCYLAAISGRGARLPFPLLWCRPHARANDVDIARSAHGDGRRRDAAGVLDARRSCSTQGRGVRAKGRDAGAHCSSATHARRLFADPAARGRAAREAAGRPKARRAHLRSVRAGVRDFRLPGRHGRLPAPEP